MANERGSALLWALLTAGIFVVGVASVQAAARLPVGDDERMVPALVAAAVAPIAALAVLAVVAPGFDVSLVAISGALVAIGTGTIYGLALAPGATGAFYADIVFRHLVFAAAGFLALVLGVLAERGIDRARQYPFTVLLAAIALTALTVLAGDTVNGARLWLDFGIVRFQPSEIARFLLAVFVAAYLYDRRYLLAAPWGVGAVDLPPAPYLVPLVGALLAAVSVLVFQNDLGMAALVVLAAGATVVSVVRSRGALALSAVLLCCGVAGAYLGVSRVRDRVLGWLDPWRDPAGRGYQFVQADYSLSAGTVLGGDARLGPWNVPEVHTDFILVAVAAQFGLLMGLAVLVLAGALVCRCLLAAMRADDGFRAFAAMGLAALIGVQIILIAGGSLRVLPLTGLTFPLVSYGGTSMVATQFFLGVIVGIGAQTNAGRPPSGSFVDTRLRSRQAPAGLVAASRCKGERSGTPWRR